MAFNNILRWEPSHHSCYDSTIQRNYNVKFPNGHHKIKFNWSIIYIHIETAPDTNVSGRENELKQFLKNQEKVRQI